MSKLRNKTKLELTWIGKDSPEKLEPRILLEDSSLSFKSDKVITENDKFDNRLIYGDNLLALKALEQEFTGEIKCVYIDPPFNTGAAFEHYDDGVEHSIWLGLMYQRFEVIHNLLKDDGFLVVHLDDSEMAYAKVILDEIFGRRNYVNTVTMTTNHPSGFKATSSTIFSTANYLLIYAKEKSKAKINKVYIEKEYDKAYSKVIENIEDEPTDWEYKNISDVVANNLGFKTSKEAVKALGDEFDSHISQFAIENAHRVFQTAAIGGGAKIKRGKTIKASLENRNQVMIHPGEDVDGFYILNGRQILFYNKRLVEIDGEKLPGEILTDVWTNIKWNGIAQEGGVDFKNGKKPELLLKRLLEMFSNEGDWVLDSFAGSGTTGAVAHKIDRRWIMIELGEQCFTHVIPRLKRVVSGEDQKGISKLVGWKGGGGFKYYHLAPSLLEKDKYGNWVINKKYNFNMLAEAMCKLKGFTYQPEELVFWKQGQSTETDYIFTTTQLVTRELVEQIQEQLGKEETLLICCKAFNVNSNDFPAITFEKIPPSILESYEYGRNDYSLEIASLPQEVISEKKDSIRGGDKNE